MDRRQADAVEVAEHLLHRPLGIGQRPVAAQGVQRIPRRAVDLDDARVRDLDALALEEPLAERVRHGRAVEGGVDVDRVAGSRGVKLGEGRQPVLGELARHQPADRRDEGAFGDALRPLADHVLRFGDGEGRLDRARLVAGAAAHQLHVKVVVDHAGDDGPAPQVDRVGAAARGAGCVADLHEPAVGDAHLGHHRPLRVHGVDLPVGQQQEPPGGAGLRRMRWTAAARWPAPLPCVREVGIRARSACAILVRYDANDNAITAHDVAAAEMN